MTKDLNLAVARANGEACYMTWHSMVTSSRHTLINQYLA